MKRKRNKYPNGYRDKIAYHREQGNDEKVKYFEEKQRRLDANISTLEITIEVFEFLGYRVKEMSDSVIMCQKHPKLVSVPISMALFELDCLEVLTKIAGKIHKVDEDNLQDRLKKQWCALINTDHFKLKSLLYEYKWINKDDFMWKVWEILASEKLI